MDNFLHSREGKSRILCHLLQEFPFWLDRTRDGCAAFLWIFDRSFADYTDFFSCCLANHQLPFGKLIPDKSAQIKLNAITIYLPWVVLGVISFILFQASS